MLEIRNLSFSYDDKVNIIEDINISLDKNKFVSILGESGVGKTTIFNIIAGILPYKHGDILLDGNHVNLRGKVSYMLQKDMLFAHKNIVDNIALPLIIKGINKTEAKAEALELLKEFKLEKWAKSYPSELSGGMKQRVALLRTYMFKNDIILLDEAFNALDTMTKSEIYEWYLEAASKLNFSTLLITHNVDEAILLSDTIYIMQGKPGKISLKIDIDISRPRYLSQTLNEDFIAYKRKIYEVLMKI